MQREIEWQRLHPGMDALLSHRSKNVTERAELVDEEDDSIRSDSDSEFDDETIPKKRGASTTSAAVSKRAAATTTTRGRGRGRGRASAPALSMTSDNTVNTNATAPSASKWPPRR